MKIFRNKLAPRFTSTLMLFVYANLTVSCRFFTSKPLKPNTNEQLIAEIKKKERYIIVHQGDLVRHLGNVAVDDSTGNITGILEPLPVGHMNYKKVKKPRQAYRYKKTTKANNPVFEIHLYTSIPDVSENITIPFSTINRVDVYSRHQGASALAITGGVVIGAGVLVGIAALIVDGSSCPFIYTETDSTSEFAGEIFAGAIYPSLERNDYLPLPQLQSNDGKFNLVISNELLEKQYTNLATLITVDHPVDTKVLLDKYGKVQTLGDLVAPITAKATPDKNYRQILLERDTQAFQFDNEISREGDGTASITVSFPKPRGVKTGKLLLNAKNSYWMDYLYGKFNEQFGTYYNTFASNQRKESAEKLHQWSNDQSIPLAVYVQIKYEWRLVDTFPCIGPLASRDMVMAVDLAEVTTDNVTLKLQSGFMFWDVDYAAMDFTPNTTIKMIEVSPSAAFDQNGKDVTALVTASDDQYLRQPSIDDRVEISYQETKPATGLRQTIFLHGKGYYEYIRDYKNLPDVAALMRFKKPGALPMFSRELYREFTFENRVLAAALTESHEE